ncbi:hypothetical protein QC761_704193 [Podospora bellae-mahoneyi]|uniref:Uncharacterized protein n=1 Tax=Podospora bellae-mahoneyi TaxID=2093777 RepID=A0ABR0F4R8_9PEZI|nr:hypothetical protein QC761_704193 [Podospora bellae-mahoneyi]
MMAEVTANSPDDECRHYASTAVPIVMASIAWAVHNGLQDLLSAWEIYLIVLLASVLVLSIATRVTLYAKSSTKPADLAYEVSNVSFEDVRGYLEDGCPRTSCLHNIWSDYEPVPTTDQPQCNDEEPKTPSIWDGKAEFSCTSSDGEIIPNDSVTQHGIIGWEIRVLMIQHDKLQERRLEKAAKNKSGFPEFKYWPRDPSLTYKQNWSNWYAARKEYRRLHPPSEEELAEERQRRKEQEERIEKRWYEKHGIPRPAPLPKICVVDVEGKVEDLDGMIGCGNACRRVEESYRKPGVDEAFLWPYWPPKNAQEEWESTLIDEGEEVEDLWTSFGYKHDELKARLVWDDLQTY